MRQETVALKAIREEIAAARLGRFEAVPDDARHLIMDLIDELLELRDAVCDMDEKIRGLEGFVAARNAGALAPNPPRVMTLGNVWAPKRRLRVCIEAWPECEADGYNPRCCRFPKSCSCTVYPDDIEDDALEPVKS